VIRPHFDFIGKKWIWFAASGTIIVIGLIAVLLGGLHFGVEFQGGTLLDIKFAKTQPSVAEIRKTVAPFKMEESVIQLKEGNEALIRTRRLSTTEVNEVENALKKSLKVTAVSTTTVGPGWGDQVTNGAIKALLFSLLVLVIYISIRFEYKMALASLVAIFHDIFVVIGVYAILGLVADRLSGGALAFLPQEVTPNTVAALLTILGYSLYDNIVVFHRIQENTPLIGKRTYSEMANDSVNQVLLRSINTSLASLIPIVVLLLFGGDTLKDFAFVLFVGMISGAYSTIFIGSPVFAMLKEIEPRYRVARERFAGAREAMPLAEAGERLAEEFEGPEPAPSQARATAAQKAKKKKKKKRR